MFYAWIYLVEGWLVLAFLPHQFWPDAVFCWSPLTGGRTTQKERKKERSIIAAEHDIVCFLQYYYFFYIYKITLFSSMGITVCLLGSKLSIRQNQIEFLNPEYKKCSVGANILKSVGCSFSGINSNIFILYIKLTTSHLYFDAFEIKVYECALDIEDKTPILIMILMRLC